MPLIKVVLDAELAGGLDREAWSGIGDAIMESLISCDARDPSVAMDLGESRLLVEVVVQAEAESSALATGATLIDHAIRSALETEAGSTMHGPSARAEVLTPA